MDEPELHNSLVELHSASLAWAMSCCRERELAEEVLQSVYAKLLDEHAPYTGGSSFRTWLFAAIRNAARDHQRKRWWSRVLRLEFDSLANLANSALVDHSANGEEEELEAVRVALGKLPDRQRQVAHLVFYEDLTIEEAAKVMGVTLGTARQHYARAKTSLRSSLKPLQNRTDESTFG